MGLPICNDRETQPSIEAMRSIRLEDSEPNRLTPFCCLTAHLKNQVSANAPSLRLRKQPDSAEYYGISPLEYKKASNRLAVEKDQSVF
jgi:hypothetical protein